MAVAQFIWYRTLEILGEKTIDLYTCRRFIVKEHTGELGSESLVFYLTKENVWIEEYGFDRVNRHGEYEFVEFYRECHAIKVAHELLANKTYGDRLPEGLNEYREYGDKLKYQNWLAQFWPKDEERPTLGFRPNWDRKAKTVTFNGKLCKRFAKVATSQFKLLDLFQGKKWASCVKSPLDSRLELKNTIDSMNDWPGSAISFGHNGLEACWEVKSQE